VALLSFVFEVLEVLVVLEVLSSFILELPVTILQEGRFHE
jgi:hypothetical protein